MHLDPWETAALVFGMGLIISFLVALMIKALSLLLHLVEQKSDGSI